jgi:hypothetical protein
MGNEIRRHYKRVYNTTIREPQNPRARSLYELYCIPPKGWDIYCLSRFNSKMHTRDALGGASTPKVRLTAIFHKPVIDVGFLVGSEFGSSGGRMY